MMFRLGLFEGSVIIEILCSPIINLWCYMDRSTVAKVSKRLKLLTLIAHKFKSYIEFLEIVSIFLPIPIYNEHIHINVGLISIQIYSDITLLLLIINCNKIRLQLESNSTSYEF